MKILKRISVITVSAIVVSAWVFKVSAEEPTLIQDPGWLESFIDQQFDPLVNETTPGFGVLITYKGQLRFAKGYGLADIEHTVPIDQHSKFYIASMSKQFTAAIIAQHILEGRIGLDDKCIEFLPTLPDVYRDITIGQLLFHTSGIREYTSMMIIRGDDPRLQNRMNMSDAYQLITSQGALDFPSGTQYRYSSSGYVLLAKILEEIENKPFPEIAKERLFAPLGMQNTTFDIDHSAPIPGRVKSYQAPSGGDDKVWRRWLKHFDVVGDGGILVTLTDMAKWDRELRTGAFLGTKWRDLMMKAGARDDGTILPYGFGLWQSEVLGNRVVAHGGGMGGFIADQIRFSDLDLSVYVFANRNDHNAFQGWKLARRLVQNMGMAKPDHELSKNKQGDAVPMPSFQSAKAHDYSDWIGGYFADKINNRYFLREKTNGQLVLHGGGDTWLSDLEVIDNERLRCVSTGQTITLKTVDGVKILILEGNNQAIEAINYDYSSPSNIHQLAVLEGSFWSPELESLVSFYIKDDILWMRYAQNLPEQLFPAPTGSNLTWNSIDKLWTGRSMIKFRYDEAGKIKGVDIGDSRVVGVRFRKLDADSPITLHE
ncbi:serine hydrolase [Kordiimonas sp. SCSIO 12610]|uniref:serine hydrolase domain-containing protein n=1 Tax=Kordiimonas sp. SCSIO 12610 TaxID=2829597 RepID=UPI00210B1CDC|nr:serine hydrolase domain-containing protein [Kordiimonas sp. SCSIO 12610]UTW55694.1 beta-lactamase family protein [Kordiimonas sp. SCSIO 12610]